MTRSPLRRRLFAVVVATTALTVVGTGPGHAASTTAVVVQPPDGAAKPVPGTGIGTEAAMDAERCNTGAQFGVYGRWDSSSIGMGPLCVRPFESGDDNGGATSKGVTATAIKLVAVLPSPSHGDTQAAAAQLLNRADNSQGTCGERCTTTCSRTCRSTSSGAATSTSTVYNSTGIDETAQRADLVAIRR